MSSEMVHSNSEYYGVFVPQEHRNEEVSDANFVFHVKEEALACAKLFKKARFKAFPNYTEAVKFAQNGLEVAKLEIGSDGETKVDSAMMGEKPSPFRAPKPQELVKFRKSIETGDIDKVKETMWDNPRYLVSSGDTPSILQEGFRYNALHIAAKAKNHEVCDLILFTISDEAFIKLLYGDSSSDLTLIKDRIQVLLDLYLNTPDKGLNETPLHFAVKFGAPEVVRVLVSYPQCDKTLKNKYGKSADMIICDRCEGDTDVAAKKRQISLLLEGSYYVPVLRAEDNTVVPIIGEPFSPGCGPALKEDPMSPRLEIRAYAGPLNRREAEQFRRVWKTPPRSKGSSGVSKVMQAVTAMRYRDAEKGLERLGNTLASRYRVEWKEYWPFLDSFVDISSDEGLRLLEDYLAVRMTGRSDSSREMSQLANLLEGCTLKDSLSPRSSASDYPEGGQDGNSLDPHLCLEKACQVYANRLSNSILQVGDKPPSAVAHVMRKEIVHVHCMISSYLDDARFTSVDFRIVHNSLGKMTGQKILETVSADELSYIKQTLTALKTELSNDDSFNGAQDIDTVASGEKYDGNVSPKSALESGCTVVSIINCLLDKILNSLNPPKNPVWWSRKEKQRRTSVGLDDCICDLRSYHSSDGQLFSRSHSMKRKPLPLFLDVGCRMGSDQAGPHNQEKEDTEDLRMKRDPADSGNAEQAEEMEDDSCGESDEFYTPPSTPEPEDVDMQFEDAKTLREDIFIEGEEPTKMDSEVYEALLYPGCIPSAKDFPRVYKWYHAVSLYSDDERHRWQNTYKKNTVSPPNTSYVYDAMEVQSPSSPLSKQFNSPTSSKRMVNSLLAQECKSPPQHQLLNSPKARTWQPWFKVTGPNSPRASLKRKLT